MLFLTQIYAIRLQKSTIVTSSGHPSMQYLNAFIRYDPTPQNVYPDIDNILDKIEKKEIDLDYLCDYIELKQYNIRSFSKTQCDRIVSIITKSFVRECEATFYFTKAIQFTRTIYTHQLTGPVLYVYDDNRWVLLTDFLKVYESIRNYK